MAFSGADLGQMATLASTLRSRGQDLQSLIGAIDGPVAQSAGFWKGKTQTDLQSTWDQVKPLMSRLVGELESFHAFTSTTSDNINTAVN